MSEFSVNVVRVSVEPHPDPETTALELVRVGGYLSVVRKGQFRDGDLAAYIPEASVLPQVLLEELNLVGRLGGAANNRVKAIRLRGVLSQGICYTARPGWAEGQDVARELGVIKWEAPIPPSLSGEVYFAGHQRTIRYDIENVKKYPNLLAEDEQVVMTEKIHGTWCQVGVVPETTADPIHGRIVVSSKGLAAQGLAFKPDVPANATNLYLRANRALRISERIDEVTWKVEFGARVFDEPVFVLGEIFGHGVQDLSYGASTGKDETLGFRAFDIYIGVPGRGRYLNDSELSAACEGMGLDRVPVLYRGPYTQQALAEATNGKETVSGKQVNIREGCVVRPTVERRDESIGRVQLKSVSADYLLRKNGTELT